MIQSMCIMLTILHIFLTLIGLCSLKAHFSWQGAKRTYLILSNINMNLYNWTIFLKYVESEKTLTSSVISDVISFFVTKKMSKLQRMNSSYLLNDLRNFNEIFTKCVTYDNSHKKKRVPPFTEDTFFEPCPLQGSKDWDIKYQDALSRNHARVITKHPEGKNISIIEKISMSLFYGRLSFSRST